MCTPYLGHFFFTTKVKDVCLIRGYDCLRTPHFFLHTCQNLNLHDICSDANYHVLICNESQVIRDCGINTRTMMPIYNANTCTKILSLLILYKPINLHNCNITDCSFWPSIMPYALRALVTFLKTEKFQFFSHLPNREAE